MRPGSIIDVSAVKAAHTLANETGGEVLSDKLERLDTTFQTLIDHLRSRYNLAFVSTNRKRDGTKRKLKLDCCRRFINPKAN